MNDLTHLQDTIVSCERKVWDALVTGDQQTDAAALADDFLGVYADGHADKAAHVGQLDAGATIADYRLSEHQFRALAPHVMLFSYRADFQRVKRDTPEAMYVTSIWEDRGSGWVNIFSQDTPV